MEQPTYEWIFKTDLTCSHYLSPCKRMYILRNELDDDFKICPMNLECQEQMISIDEGVFKGLKFKSVEEGIKYYNDTFLNRPQSSKQYTIVKEHQLFVGVKCNTCYCFIKEQIIPSHCPQCKTKLT